MEKSFVKGYVHSFESLAALDGDGLRLAVFLSGCPLECVYCHNPDTRRSAGEIYTPEQIAAKAGRYKHYFKTRGGVTFSGGEPLLQAEFVSETGRLLVENGINYVLDTSGAVKLTSAVRNSVEAAELIILDLKFWDSESYKKYCGGNLSQILEFGDYLEESRKRVWLRTVIVPGINDTAAHVEKYASLAARWKNAERHELLGFHTMGFEKYEKAGIENPLEGTADLDADTLICLQRYLDELRKQKK